MLTVWKYTLKITDEQIIKLPEVAEPLSVQMQRDSLVMWWLVETDPQKLPTGEGVDVEVIICGTGKPVPEDCRHGKYVGTVQVTDTFVIHVWVK